MRMPQRFWRYLAIVGCLCVLGLDSGVGAPRARPSRVTAADDEAKIKRINQQLDEILAVQETILKRYEELMEELQVVKVRASH